MITKVVHGWRPGGLIAYLMGPGRAEEHRRPRVIASWDGQDAAWQPARTGPGEWDFALGPLSRALRAPVVAAGLPEADDGSGRRGHVWHLSARVARADRILSDGEWAQVARDLLDGAGIAGRDDPGGPRWVAIRHADDHIHVAVVLVRQDTGRRFWPHRDFPRLRQAAREVEAQLGLTLTAAADGTAARAPGRGEIEKARRQGREPARVELAQAVRVAALAGDGPEEFAAALRDAGYLVELRHAPSGDVIGYKVARQADVTAAGEAVFYSGSKLAADLSMPRLQRRWSGGPERGGPMTPRTARRRIDRARRTVAAARRRGSGGAGIDGELAEIAAATGDVLVASQDRPAGEGLRTAADLFDRASRAPRGWGSGSGRAGAGLRHVARQMVRQRYVAGREADDPAATVALLVALAALVREIAGWQRDRNRVHQSVTADAAADVVERCSAALSGSTVEAAPDGPGVRDEHRPAATRDGDGAAGRRDQAAGPRQAGSNELDPTTRRPWIDRGSAGPSREPRG